jgi:hypothetical protein
LEHLECTKKPWANTNSQDSPWPGLGGSHHLPPYSIICVWPWALHSNVILCRNSQIGNPKIPKMGTLATLEAHNFVCRPSIEVGSQSKLWPLLKAFQRYVARHLHIRKSRRFLTFSGQESNFPSFDHNLCFKYPNGSYKPILDI